MASSFDAAKSRPGRAPTDRPSHDGGRMREGDRGETGDAQPDAQTSLQAFRAMSWHGIVLQMLKRNDIRLVPYVPDRV